jgi:ABC-type multidrug transport system fused ATPase/permease subunit
VELSVLMCILSIFASIGQLIAPLEMVSRASKAAGDFFTLIDSTHHHPPDLLDAQPLANLAISLKNVHFAYPSRPQVKILDGLNVSFEAGKVTAIVGPSGSGKSTVVGLIQKWYNLTQQNVVISDAVEGTQDGSIELSELEPPLVTLKGNICIGDIDLEEVETKSWRCKVGLVAQTPFLFNDTIRNNVLFGLQGSQWEHADQPTKEMLLKEACKEAYADEFISQLPQVSCLFRPLFESLT